MNKDIINVVLASDDNYAQPLGVALYSMLDNFSSEKHKIKITVLDGGIHKEKKDKILAIGKVFNTEINFIRISDETFADFPIMQHYSVAIYYRLIIPSLFSKEIKKIIYLDCDILVLGNIAELYDTSLDDYYIGGVKDFISDQHLANTSSPFYGKMKKMFNSGVLLLNLEKIRKENFVNKTLDFIKENSKQLTWPDQEALNIISADCWLELDKIWNYQIDISQTKVTPQPKILHYTNSYKPWHGFYSNYYQNIYMQYLFRSWPHYVIKQIPFKTKIKQVLKRLPYSVPLVRLLKKIVS